MANSTRARSRAGMELLVHRAEVFAVDVRVDLRGRDVYVAEHLLHRPQIRASFQQVRRERMTESMRRHGLGDSGLVHVLAEDLPRAHAGQGSAASVKEQDSLALTFLQLRTKLAQIDGDRSDRSAANGNEALLGAFPEYAYEVVLKHHIADAERNPFRDSQSRAIRQLEHCPVAERERLVE